LEPFDCLVGTGRLRRFGEYGITLALKAGSIKRRRSDADLPGARQRIGARLPRKWRSVHVWGLTAARAALTTRPA